MLIRRQSILLVALAASGMAFARQSSDVQIRTTRSGANVTSEQSLGDGKSLVRVADAKQEPVLGLGENDFAVAGPGGAARVTSVEPVTKTVEVPRHVVLVLDNSQSMVDRNAVARLLEEVGALMKTIRPIDDVHLVIYRDKKTVKMGDHALHVETFQSSKPSELEAFTNAAYTNKNITETTPLYEAMVAGLELIRQMPAKDPRFLMVFTDGEEINSAFKGEVVAKTAHDVPNLYVFAIDYMPGPKIDPFLASVASQNHGQAAKAGTGAAVPAVFQQSASRVEHYYAVSYEFAAAAPPPPVVRESSKSMVFAETALFDFNKSDLKPEGKKRIQAYREKVKEEMNHADAVKIIGHTDNFGHADYNQKLSVRRATAVRDYLVGLGVDPGKLQVSGEGQSHPVADNDTKEGRAKNRRVEVEVIGVEK
jgi:outer membrane protein OmpA-like peptidoglycan-associated protein